MPEVKLLATGDSMLTHAISATPADAFQELVALLRGADATITNVEMSYPGRGRHPSTTMHGTPMGADPGLLSEYEFLGIDLYGMANNHATDYGTDGLVATLEALERRNMRYAGAGRTLREARQPCYFDAPGGRVAFVAAGSSNARLALAADIGIGDAGRPGIAPVRLQKTHYIKTERFGALRDMLAEAGVNIASTGTTAPGIHFPYPDRNVYDSPPPGGIAVESVHFVADDNPRVQTDALERDVQALISVVDEAKRMADLVVVALHCHEGLQGRWNTDVPAEFLQPLAHRLIDAGAHAIIGHGPHMLRGVELYRNRPICYSLGNFIFNLEATAAFPLEVYEQQGMPLSSTTADLYDAVTGYQKQPFFWESVVAQFTFSDGELAASELHPITMAPGLPRSRRGTPTLTDVEEGTRILSRLDGLSWPFGTTVEIDRRNGRCFGRMVTSK
jgi:poly-gamma-glutamate synthesis protein (capsule biosynthesis protein)